MKTQNEGKKIENEMKRLDLIEKLNGLLKNELIAEKDFQKKKDKILETF